MIVTESLNKSYQQGHRQVNVFSNLSLCIRRGEFVAISGTSGAGKSTLLQLLGCLDTATSGRYWLDGQEVSSLKDKELAVLRNQRIGFVFQTSYFIDYLDLVDNVALHGFYQSHYNERALRRKARQLLAQAGLGHRLTHRPMELSGGERQRAAMARAMFADPDLILADEPTGNLDTQNSERLAESLLQLNRSGMTIILVTHDLSLAKIAQRQLRLADGILTAVSGDSS